MIELPKSISLGNLVIQPPVVLAPMAGVTNVAFRQLCAEFGAGLYVCEMVTARGIVERIPKTFEMLQFAPGEIRSVQLYGVDAAVIGQAVKILCAEFGVEHIDINLGCPVPKVTKKGGGGVLPWKLDRVREILTQMVRNAEPFGVPITVKTRMGIDDAHLTSLDVARIAQEVGVKAITLHGRTVLEAYSGQAHWEAIAQLVQEVEIPVLGNGDIWEAADAARMIAETNCAGVVVGRGCLGRPWLFRDLADLFAGRKPQPFPRLGEVMQMVKRHGELLCEAFGEPYGLIDLRKHMSWYFKGFPVGGELRRALSMISSFNDLAEIFAQLDPEAKFPKAELGKPRGRQGSARTKVHMPYGWLDSRFLGTAEIIDDDGGSGG